MGNEHSKGGDHGKPTTHRRASTSAGVSTPVLSAPRSAQEKPISSSLNQGRPSMGSTGAIPLHKQGNGQGVSRTSTSVPTSRPLSIQLHSGGHYAPNASLSGRTPNASEQPFTPSSPTPHYVDSKSLVYAAPTLTDSGCIRTSSSENEIFGPSTTPIQCSGHSTGIVLPQPSARASPTSSDHLMYPLHSPGKTGHSRLPQVASSTPIMIPVYNPKASAVDEGGSGSPVLRSYKQNSFSISKDFTSQHGCPPSSSPLVFSGSGSFSISGASFTHASNPSLAVSPGRPGTSCTGSTPQGSQLHTRFMEITSYPLGLENYGQTCYCNSVVQLLYHCTPLRLRLLELHEVYTSKKGGAGFEENTLLFHICNLFSIMHKSNNRRKDKRREVISPQAFLQRARELNPTFNNNMQHDAHEFAIFVLSEIIETEHKMMCDPKNKRLFSEEGRKKKHSLAFWRKDHMPKGGSAAASSNHGASNHAHEHIEARGSIGSQRNTLLEASDVGGASSSQLTPLQDILQGQFASITACLECFKLTVRNEVFLDLSLETGPGCSLLRCLEHFGDPEYFFGDNKVRCDDCGGPVRAVRTIHVQHLPQYALLIHLKRFQYDVQQQKFTKKSDHVALPMEIDVEEHQLWPEDEKGFTGSKISTNKHPERECPCSDSDSFKPASDELLSRLRGVARHKARFMLTGIVVHVGEGPNIGHYVTLVRFGLHLWRKFDDDVVTELTEREVQQCFGVSIHASRVVTSTAYMLLYERVA